MSVRSAHLKLVGAAGAATLAVGMVAAPAVAAATTMQYNCPLFAAANGFPGSNGQEELVTTALDPGTLPTTMVVGQKVTNADASIVVSLDPFQTGAAATFGTSVSGSLVADGAGGTLAFNMPFSDTAIPQTPGQSMEIDAAGPATIRPTRTGTWTLNAGDMTANLTVSGGPGGTTTVPEACTAPTDGSQALGTITVTKDTTKTTTSAAYSAKKDKATGTAKVKSHYGTKATGKVTFTLKKGKKTVAKATASLKKGVAKHAFSKVKKSGKYTITAKYAGNSNLKGSSDGASFRVK